MAHTPQTSLIVGADGGIGAAYLNACLATPAAANASTNYVLTSRRPVSACRPDLNWLQLDFSESSTLDQLQEQLTRYLKQIDRLIIASGLLHHVGLKPEKGLSQLKSHAMQHLFTANAAGPLAVLAALEPLLKDAESPKIAILSAQVGSIEDNHMGGWYSYRMSKAALNMGIKTAAIEMARWKNDPVVVAVHPGTTHSSLSKPFVVRRKAPVQSAASAGIRLQQLIEQLTPEDNGKFLTLDHQILPW